MKRNGNFMEHGFRGIQERFGLSMRPMLITILLIVNVIPLLVLTAIAWRQMNNQGDLLQSIAVEDSSIALNDSAVENIERMTTDTARNVAEFLYGRDDDILYLAGLDPSENEYSAFLEQKTGRLIQTGEWVLADDGKSWVPVGIAAAQRPEGVSRNQENNDNAGFRYRHPELYEYKNVPLYDEITFIDISGNELYKVVAEDSTKKNYPLNTQKRDVSDKQNTYVGSETYFEKLKALKPGEIYVSDVIGAYVGSNYIGMYTPDIVAEAAKTRGYDIEFSPETQSYSGMENPNGQRFEGIVRWATPVTNESGSITGYVTFALNHDHIMEFVDHITPMGERYTELPSAYEGNYAFIWDYQCRSICHPRHHSIVGYDPETGEEQIPWLESSIYDAWQASGVTQWTEFIKMWPEFDEQSRNKTPALALTKAGLVGLDGRYLNNAPQCTGWMDLTEHGGSGSFYILWSGIYKLTTAAAIPYYTGQYAPSEANDYSERGFGIVTIGAGLEDFTRPAVETEEKLGEAITQSMSQTSTQLIATVIVIVIFVVMIAIWIASSLSSNINELIAGISRFRAGERQFRFMAPGKDEFSTLANSFDDMAESIVSSVKNPLSITDKNRKVIYMNEEGLEFCKMSLDEIVGTAYKDSSIYPGNSKYDPILALENNMEAEIFFEEGSKRYLKGSARHFINKEGEKIGYIIETMDMTDMVLEQIRIEGQKSLLDKIFSASPDLIWYVDTDGEFLAVNPRFAAVIGLSPEEFVGKTVHDLFPRDFAESFRKLDMDSISSFRPLYTEERVEFADGHTETLDVVRTPIYDQTTGTLVGLLGFASNVTARVEIESKLRSTQLDLEQAVDEANKANEHKGEFLARMSHEIRTPMNAIIGITSIVQKKLEDVAPNEQTDEIKSRVQQIEASSQHLLGLLNDILDISKIEAGKIELTDEPTEIHKLANTVAAMIKPRCDEKGIVFQTSFDTFSPSTFMCDSLRLRQVLINLLGNAVKFTPELGYIEFCMEHTAQEDDRTMITFRVRDTGIGISAEAQAAIFQPFEQGGSGVSKKYGGTGLGLAISRRIVQLFGGDIELISEPGEGSEFSFSIWLHETEDVLPEEVRIADATSQFAGKKMLLVDDVQINRMIVASMLENTGMEIDEADDGLSALQTFKDSPEGTYDIILMDVQMPNMDGYEASAAIRALEREDAKTVPIVALTANAFKEDMDKALGHGMNAHVAKPVETDVLLEVLFRYLREKE
ncbi:response regulator [Eubacteriales bacterium OttesenSCG-928-K08]|nr:response regulator [Eubacteriales bacterium OttesenSCG-928-K08]